MPAGLRRLVLSIVAIGAAAQAVVAFFTRDTGAVTSLAGKLPWAHGLVLLALIGYLLWRSRSRARQDG